MPKLTITKEQQQDAINKLREFIKVGDCVYTILNHVSASGMQRGIGLVVPIRDKYNKGGLAIQKLDWLASKALGYRVHQKYGGLIVNGCGMDMGYHLVYQLGEVLWPKGTKKPHGTRNGEPDSTGGYAIKHSWL